MLQKNEGEQNKTVVVSPDLNKGKPESRFHSDEDNRIVMELAMSNPLKNLPNFESRSINITPISVA
jgi:hypothetical protein